MKNLDSRTVMDASSAVLSRGELEAHYRGAPQQKEVAKIIYRNGLTVIRKRIYAHITDQIPISASAIAKVADVDRRVVGQCLETISQKQQLKRFFSLIKLSGPSTELMGPEVSQAVVELLAHNPNTPGIVQNVTQLFSEANVSINCLYAESPLLSNEPRLVIIAASPITAILLEKLRSLKGIKKVSWL